MACCQMLTLSCCEDSMRFMQVQIKWQSRNFQRMIVLGHGPSLRVIKLVFIFRLNFVAAFFHQIKTWRYEPTNRIFFKDTFAHAGRVFVTMRKR